MFFVKFVVGYTWNSDIKQCEDIDECQFLDNQCDPYSEECQNTIGSFTCECITPDFVSINGVCVDQLLTLDGHSVVFDSSENDVTQVLGLYIESKYADFQGVEDFRSRLRKKRNIFAISDIVDSLPSYGCHCPSLAGLVTFPGSMDAIDTTCAMRTLCMRCTECEQTDYTMELDLTNSALVCTDDVNTCAYKTCACEKNFVEQVGHKIVTLNLFDTFNLDIEGEIDCIQEGISAPTCDKFDGIF